MKKYKHKYTVISLLYMIGMLFTGCDGFLDVELDNQIKLEEVFNKRSTTEQYLAQVYGFVPQTYNWHENAVGASVPMSDEALFSWMSGLGYHSFLNGTWSVTTTSYAIWKNMYQAINQATLFMFGEMRILIPAFMRKILIATRWKQMYSSCWKNMIRLQRFYLYR